MYVSGVVYMFHAPAILAEVRSGRVPTTWRVLPAQKSFFVRSIPGTVIFLLLVLGFLFWFNFLQDEMVIVPKFWPGELDETQYLIWYLIDNLIGLIVVGFISWFLIRNIRNASTAPSQVLVITPEGVVMDTAKKTPASIDFASVSTLVTHPEQNGESKIEVASANAPQKYHLEIDGRFGSPNILAQEIEGAYRRFRLAQLPQQQ